MKFFLFFCVILFTLSTEVLSHHPSRFTKRDNSTELPEFRRHSKRQNPFGKNRGGGGGGIDGFCKKSKKTPADGTQNRNGACVSTVLGELPSADKMVTCILTNPANGAQLKANTAFNVEMVIKNIQTGAFSDPAKEYYITGQTLNANGFIIGHTHVTIQQIDSPQTNNPPDPAVFAFFKGADQAADGQGKLTIPVDNGLPPGNYRICTLSSSLTHQSVIMPVAQRGSQDDCIRMKVK
ncbi:hypothetical protein Glove_214g39 [Diversispora epigaea]|uniref:Uncharacterized protein n=1 Tax=Diversispora epigaea TaxID=1348612 RepID=A0A397IHD0_9GLOM|nr:hypothetical protein Glove_214g39 [Diversispora epigaea]